LDRNKREPFTRHISPSALLDDLVISEIKSKLNNLKEVDFPIKTNLDLLIPILDNPELMDSFQLIKLLYCLGYKRQSYLFLGVIIENLLNKTAKLYIDNGVQMINPANSNTINFNDVQEKFINKPLCDKLGIIIGYNLFQDTRASEYIYNGIKGLSVFRNYGGHSGKNEFINACLENTDLTDEDIKQCILLILKINEAHNALVTRFNT
jgi:hypothetical protein